MNIEDLTPFEIKVLKSAQADYKKVLSENISFEELIADDLGRDLNSSALIRWSSPGNYLHDRYKRVTAPNYKHSLLEWRTQRKENEELEKRGIERHRLYIEKEKVLSGIVWADLKPGDCFYDTKTWWDDRGPLSHNPDMEERHYLRKEKNRVNMLEYAQCTNRFIAKARNEPR